MKSKLPVEEFTTPNPVTVPGDLSIDEARLLMREYDIRHLPVLREDIVVGIVSDRDLRVAQGLGSEHKLQIRVADIMASDPVSVDASTPLDEVAFEMSARKIGSVLVNKDSGDFLGIFTVTDALDALIEIVRTGR